jgi:hypothetical protein
MWEVDYPTITGSKGGFQNYPEVTGFQRHAIQLVHQPYIQHVGPDETAAHTWTSGKGEKTPKQREGLGDSQLLERRRG